MKLVSLFLLIILGGNNMEVKRKQQLMIENLIAKTTFLSKQMNGATIIENDIITAVDSDFPSYNANIITLKSNEAEQIEDSLPSVLSTYTEKNHPKNIWSFEENKDVNTMLENIGLSEYETSYIAMIANLFSMRPSMQHHDEMDIQRIQSPKDIIKFGEIISTLYQGTPEAKAIQNYYSKAANIPLSKQENFHLYKGIYEGEIVTIGSLMITGNTAGIYDMVTLEKMRGKGFATFMIQYLINQAKSRNVAFCTLQASSDGANIYKRVGFEPIGTLKVYE